MNDPYYELRQVIARLELISHAPTVNLEGGSPSSEHKGGRRPPGGVDRRDDREPEFLLKSAEHFKRRLAGARSSRAVVLILADARASLEAWQRSPVPDEPTLDDPRWKRWVAESDKPAAEVARLYGVSRQYVHRIRQQYQ